MATTQLMVDAHGEGWREVADVDRISDLLADHNNLLWLDLADPGPEELELLGQEFGFHELALEDVARAHQRPKCDTYHDYYFIVVYAATHSANRFLPTELQLLWGESYVVTIHRGALPMLDEARKRWLAHEEGRPEGA